MTDYNDGKWYGWNGGECPVHPETLVEYVTENDHLDKKYAEELYWEVYYRNPVIAFRVIKPYREPREVYLNDLGECRPSTPGAVLFREVIE